MIFVTAIAMIVNVCASKPDQLRRNEALEEMVHPMGCGDDQEKQQCDGGLQGQAALDGRYVSSAGHRGLLRMLVVRTHQRKLYGQHGTWVHLTVNSTLSLASSSVVWSLAVAGEAGAQFVLEELTDELRIAMAMCGLTSPDQATRDLVAEIS